MARVRSAMIVDTGAGEKQETPEALKQAARQAAVKKIKAQFVDSAKLNDIGLLKADYQKHLVLVESEIRGVQDAKLASAGQVQDTLGSMHQQMQDLRTQHTKLRDLVSYCQALLAPYPKIREASSARQNLRMVLAHIDQFNSAVDTVDDLEALLDEPMMLMELWWEVHRLLQWKNLMMERLRIAQTEARASSLDAESDELAFFQKMLEFLGLQFSRVDQMRSAMVDQVLSGLEEQLTELAPNPAKLVQCLQVTQAVEVAQAVEKEEAVAQAGEGEEELAVFRLNHIALRDQVLKRTREVVRRRAAKIFSDGQMEMADREVGLVRATLNPASQLLSDLTVVRAEVVPCFPPSIDILMIWRTEYEEFLLGQITSLYDANHVNDLDGEDLLTINEWLDYYNSLMPMIDAGGPCETFVKDAEEILEKYLEKLDSQMSKWLQTIDNDEHPVQKNLDGTLYTNRPEMFFQLVQLQVQVAKERLSGKYLSDVFLKVFGLLKSEQGKAAKEEQEAVRASFEPGAEPVMIEVLAAVINDCCRLQDNLDELMDGPVAALEAAKKFEASGLEDIRTCVQQLSSDYTLQASQANEMIVSCIMSADLGPVFARLFTRDWEANPSGMSTIVQTLKDYFVDLKRWVSSYFFCKLVRSFLENVVNDYVECLVARDEPFQNPARASKNLRQEQRDCLTFFEHYEAELAQAGVRPPLSLEERVAVLGWMADIMKSPPTEAIGEMPAAMEFMNAFGEDGPRALLRLVRKDPNATRDPAELGALLEAYAASAKVRQQFTKGDAGACSTGRFSLTAFDAAAASGGRRGSLIKGRLGLGKLFQA